MQDNRLSVVHYLSGERILSGTAVFPRIHRSDIDEMQIAIGKNFVSI